MSDMLRDCPGCGCQHKFAQHHPYPEHCQDSADERCPEWFCVMCGAGLLIGLTPAARDLTAAHARACGAAPQLDRVA